MKLTNLIRERRAEVLERWERAVLSSYPEDSAALFQRERDPFANPVGHSVREGTAGLLDALTDGMDPAGIRRYLDEVIRIRAVQQISPSEALRFLFALKPILREVVPESSTDPGIGRELIELEGRIDRLALVAFDVYTGCREEVSELRIREVKRQVSWVIEKLNRRGASFEAVGTPGAVVGDTLPKPAGETPSPRTGSEPLERGGAAAVHGEGEDSR